MQMNLWDCPGFSERFQMNQYVQYTGIRFCDVAVVLVYDVKQFDYTILNNLDFANPLVNYVVVRAKADDDATDKVEEMQIRNKIEGDLQRKGIAMMTNYKGFFLVSNNHPYDYDMKDLVATIIKTAYENRKMTCPRSVLAELDLAYPRMFFKPSNELLDEMDALNTARKNRRNPMSSQEYDIKMENLIAKWDKENYRVLVDRYSADKVNSHPTTRALKLGTSSFCSPPRRGSVLDSSRGAKRPFDQSGITDNGYQRGGRS